MRARKTRRAFPFQIRITRTGIWRFAVKSTEITENGADAHIDAMAKKYLGKDRYPFRSPSEVRVIYKIRPVKVSTMG